MKINGLPQPVAVPSAQPVASAVAPVRAPESSFVTRAAQTSGAAPHQALPTARETLGFTAETRVGPGRLLPGDAVADAAVKTALAALRDVTVAGRTFSPRSVERDGLGQVHVRFDVLQDGQRVFGKQVIGHVDATGELLGTTGADRLPGAPLRTAATPVGAEAAVDAALKAFGERADARPHAEAVFAPSPAGDLTAAYRVTLESSRSGALSTFLVDAGSGEVLERMDRRPGEAPAGGGASPAQRYEDPSEFFGAVGEDDLTLYSGFVDLGTTPDADGKHSLEDKTRGKGIVVLDTQNTTDPRNVVPIRDDDGIWGSDADPRKYDAGVDVLFGAQNAFDFLKTMFGREGIDGAGEAITAHINLGKSNHNAYWNGSVMKFGPGDKDGTSGPLVSLDVVAHELTHGLTERTADLVYAGEPGALNEAWSDIFGVGAEWFASEKNPAIAFDWKLAEDGWTPNIPGDALRYLDDPTKDGKSIDHYSKLQPRMDVHHSSGIANNAFYLLVNGGQNRTSGLQVDQGIGMDPGLQIFYRALTVYMTPDTDFAGARAATIRAATDLYGPSSPYLRSLEQAWTAVGVE